MIYIGPFIKVKTEALEKKRKIKECDCGSNKFIDEKHKFCPFCGKEYKFSEETYFEHPDYLWTSRDRFSCVTNERNSNLKDKELILIPNQKVSGFKDIFQIDEKPFLNLKTINIENELILFKENIYFDEVIKEIKEKYNITNYEVIFGILNI